MRQIPDIRQSKDHNCGEAMLACAFKMYGVPYDAPSLATELDGMHPATVENVLRTAGMMVQSGMMDLEDLLHHSKKNRLVLCPTSLYGGHWVGIERLSPTRVHFHDPVAGPSSLTRRKWMEIWKDRTRLNHSFDNWGIATWRNA